MRAVARTRAAGTEIGLSVIGRGEEEVALKRLAESLGIAGSVVFHGAVDDESLVQLLRKSRAFILASVGEPFGLVAVEAMACGTPAIVLKPGGQSETVIHGETGFCLEELDERAIAGCMERLANDDSLFARLSARATEHALEFSWEKVTEKIEGILTEALAGRSELSR